MLGVTLFAITSLACAVAPTAAFLVAARALQGVAGAVLVPASLAVLTATYDDERERGAAVGSWTAWTGIAFIIGPLAGGTLVDTRLLARRLRHQPADRGAHALDRQALRAREQGPESGRRGRHPGGAAVDRSGWAARCSR